MLWRSRTQGRRRNSLLRIAPPPQPPQRTSSFQGPQLEHKFAPVCRICVSHSAHSSCDTLKTSVELPGPFWAPWLKQLLLPAPATQVCTVEANNSPKCRPWRTQKFPECLHSPEDTGPTFHTCHNNQLLCYFASVLTVVRASVCRTLSHFLLANCLDKKGCFFFFFCLVEARTYLSHPLKSFA